MLYVVLLDISKFAAEAQIVIRNNEIHDDYRSASLT